jgi:DNA-binding MarR family transcriptional regulator
MSMEELYARPGHLIRRCQQIAVAIFMDETRDFDVTPVQYAALVAIRENPGLDATRLSALIAFDRSTIGSVLERLEAKDLIERRPGRDDRRTKRLQLTHAGALLLSAIEPAVARAQERILAPLAPAERASFLDMLGRMVDINNAESRAPLRLAAGLKRTA